MKQRKTYNFKRHLLCLSMLMTFLSSFFSNNRIPLCFQRYSNMMHFQQELLQNLLICNPHWKLVNFEILFQVVNLICILLCDNRPNETYFVVQVIGLTKERKQCLSGVICLLFISICIRTLITFKIEFFFVVMIIVTII